ncbi:MAG: hypothetical protein HOM21_09340 [Halobacteriovoraceae bacterium]|nr:hypothetical protein [Halobacteriovoraceae bacterium]
MFVLTFQNMTRPGFAKTGGLDWSGGNHAAPSCHNGQDIKRGVRYWPCLSKDPKKNKMYLDGMTPKVNGGMRDQGVVMHSANYNWNDAKMGRSFGCPAFQPGVGRKVVEQIKGGSLYYSYVPQCQQDMQIVKKQVPGWENFCSD